MTYPKVPNRPPPATVFPEPLQNIPIQPPRHRQHSRFPIFDIITILQLVFAVVCFLIALGAAFLAIWLVFHPQTPDFTLASLSLSSFNLTASTTVSAAWAANFTVYYLLSMVLLYTDIEARILYKTSLLSRNQLPPFDQPGKTLSNISIAMFATNSYILPAVGISLNDELAGGIVKYNLEVLAFVTGKSVGWWDIRRKLQVYCGDLLVSVSSKGGEGTLSGGPKPCSVQLE